MFFFLFARRDGMETSARPIEPICYFSMAVGRTPLAFGWIMRLCTINDFSTDGLLLQRKTNSNQRGLAHSGTGMMIVGLVVAGELPLSLRPARQTVQRPS